MSNFLGVITSSKEGDTDYKVLYNADAVSIVNNNGTLAVFVQGQVDELGKPAWMPVKELTPFDDYKLAVNWLLQKTI